MLLMPAAETAGIICMRLGNLHAAVESFEEALRHIAPGADKDTQQSCTSFFWGGGTSSPRLCVESCL